MLTSFFGKSNPINFLLLSIILGFFWTFHFFSTTNEFFQWEVWGKFTATLLLLVFSMLLLDFVIRKNQLNASNTYAVYIFTCLISALVPYLNLTYVLVMVFILLSLRRIFSLYSVKNDEKKILDASLWLFLATFFYFWSIWILLLLYKAIFNMPKKHARYFVIPFVSFFGIGLMAVAYFLVQEKSFSWFLDWPEGISINFKDYFKPALIIFIALAVSAVIWSTFHRIIQSSMVPKKNRPNYWLVLHALWITMAMVLFSEMKTGGEWVFAIAPISIVIGGFIESKGGKWFKELLLWLFFVLPLLSILL